LGDADGPGAHGQLGGHVARRQPVHGGAPEGLPGALLELAADQLQGPVQQALLGPLIGGRVLFGSVLRRGQRRQPRLRLGAAGAAYSSTSRPHAAGSSDRARSRRLREVEGGLPSPAGSSVSFMGQARAGCRKRATWVGIVLEAPPVVIPAARARSL